MGVKKHYFQSKPVDLEHMASKWYISYGVPEKTIYADLYSFLKNLSIFTVILFFILSFGISLLFHLFVNKPLATINNSLRDISEGQGDLTKKLSVKSKDEFSLLANYYNRFIDTISHIIREVKDLSNTNPTKVGLDWKDPDLISLATKDNVTYDPEPRGLYRAREAISDHFALYNRNMHPDNYFLCASTSEAYSWLFKLLCDPGDAVLVPKPGYPLFQHLTELDSVQVLAYRLEYAHPSGWYVNLDELSSVLAADREKRIKAIVIINPNNPTGSYIRKTERTTIIGLCEKYGLALIADEVFFDFPIDDNIERKTFVGEDRVLTFVLDGLSKRMGLPQLKLAWITLSGPNQEVSRAKKRLDLIADTFLSVSTPIMNALPFLFEHETAFLC